MYSLLHHAPLDVIEEIQSLAEGEICFSHLCEGQKVPEPHSVEPQLVKSIFPVHVKKFCVLIWSKPKSILFIDSLLLE